MHLSIWSRFLLPHPDINDCTACRVASVGDSENHYVIIIPQPPELVLDQEISLVLQTINLDQGSYLMPCFGGLFEEQLSCLLKENQP